MRPSGRLYVLVLGLVLSHGSSARAGNEDELFVGNGAALSAGAVVATVDDGSAPYYNPAGLGAVERSSVDVSASAYALRFYSAQGFLSAQSGQSDDASVTEFVAVPTQIAFVRRLGEGLALGLGYYVPRATDFVLREQLDVRAADSESSWLLNIRGSATLYLLSAGLGARLSRRVRVGVALFGSYEKSAEAGALFGSISRAGSTESAVHLAVLATATDLAGELVTGVQCDLDDRVTVGVTLKSPRLRLLRSVDDRLSRSLASVMDAEPFLEAGADGATDGGEQVALERAGRYYVGVAYRYGSGSLALEGDVQPGLRDRQANVDRVFAWNLRAGLTHALTPGVLLGVGIFTDRSTEPLGDGLVSARAHFHGMTLGLQLDSAHELSPEEPVDTIVLSTVFALRYAYGVGDTTTLRVDPNASIEDVLLQTPGYVRVHELGLHVGSALYF